MAHNARKLKHEILQILEKSPFLDAAARRVGLGRTTLYRWIHTDKKFAKKVELAMWEGRKKLNESMEGALVKTAQEGNVRAQMFYLRNNHPDYMYKKDQSLLWQNSTIDYWVPRSPATIKKEEVFTEVAEEIAEKNNLSAEDRILMRLMIRNGLFEKWLKDNVLTPTEIPQ